ncbi:MAG: hypothetical protein ABL927_11115, partial [Bdellovibrionales bacterium]
PQSGYTNNFATASMRYFYQAENFKRPDWKFTADLRDKNDFFSKVDREQLSLTNSNTLQARQVSFRYDNEKHGNVYEAGRYAIPDAGNVYNDGATLGWRQNSTWSGELFAGYNPKEINESYLEFNTDATQYGALLRYLPKSETWTKRILVNTAVVEKRNYEETDRRYIYNQSVYQWAQDSLVASMLYLDFIPRTYVQTALVNYNQAWGNFIQTEMTLSAIDVIEYRRIQSVRETLSPSPYKELSVRTIYTKNLPQRWSGTVLYGHRELDEKDRIALIGDLQMPRFLSKNMDFLLRVTTKREFTKLGNYLTAGWGYYGRKYELDVQTTLGSEDQTSGNTLHPVIIDSNVGTQISKKFFGAGGLQYSHDENAQIISMFFKVTYRFGTKDLPPLRDGAPPRGRL